LIKKYPEVITYKDTAIVLHWKTYEEKIIISTDKMVKAYKIMIDNELAKPNPDLKKVKQWYKDGKRN